MIPTIYVDDSILKGRTIKKKLNNETKAVRLNTPLSTGILPDGYITESDFRAEVKQGLKNKLEENGLL